METAWPIVAQYRAPLFTTQSGAEFSLQAGKVHNLRLAVRAVHGVIIPAGASWSFWSHVGRPSRRRGFVPGRELREGCVIPAIGGGLCQLSNALHDLALNAGLEVVERHGHTQRLPDSITIPGRDATVFWNYVDLRLRAPTAWQIEARMEHGELRVQIRAKQETASPAPSGKTNDRNPGASTPPQAGHAPESCDTCGMVRCFRHAEMEQLRGQRRVAWLVDEWWPEFATWMAMERQKQDWLMVPLNGARWRTTSYPWSTKGWAKVCEEPLFTLRRSWRSRRLQREGAARQQALLNFSAELARRYARCLPFDALHVVVSQTLLPHLWSIGALAGRTFDVLMQRPPMGELHRALDSAALRHPESRTIGDFRASEALVQAEAEALAAAARLITPHTDLARLAGPKAHLLAWQTPLAKEPASSVAVSHSNTLIFPAATLARRGCYEVREAARALGATVVLGGPVLEAEGFWEGIPTVAAGEKWREHAGVIVLPAWAGSQPRRLLQALSEGRQVITTKAAGLGAGDRVTLVPEGDPAALAQAIRQVWVRQSHS